MIRQSQLTFAICANFRPEALALKERPEFKSMEFIFWEPHCEHPPRDWESIAAIVPDHAFEEPLFIVGSCFPRALQPPSEALSYLHLHHLDSCFDLICDHQQVEDLIKQRCYLTSVGWLVHWREHLQQMGFDQKTARVFFQESTQKIVLLDSGRSAMAAAELESFANYVGLPHATIRIGLEYFARLLLSVALDWENRQLQQKLALSQETAANFALSLGLLESLTGAPSRQIVIDGIKNIFLTLFAPAYIEFYPEPQSSTPDAAPRFTDEQRQKLAKQHFLVHEAKTGFLLALHADKVPIGYLDIRNFACPDQLNPYLNLALAIAPMCSLAVNKALASEQLHTEMQALVTMTEKLSKKNSELLEAQAQIKTLAGIIPICSYCKEIRDDKGYWNKLEKFIEENSEAQFSHGICDSCLEIQFKKYNLTRD